MAVPVVLLQNSQTRENLAVQHKLNAIALGDMMERQAERYDDDELRGDVEELKSAFGLEERETTGDKGGGKLITARDGKG